MNSDARNASPMAILVVDDDEDVRKLFAAVLKGEGYRVMSSPSVPDAYAVWSANREVLDLGITDFHLNGRTGQELIDLVHAEDPDFPFLLVTGMMPDEQEEFNVRDVVGIMRKPVILYELLEAVQRILIKSLTSGEPPAKRG